MGASDAGNLATVEPLLGATGLSKKPCMAERLVNVDGETPMFVPQVLREWVADNELAHLAFKAVEFSESARGTAQYTIAACWWANRPSQATHPGLKLALCAQSRWASHLREAPRPWSVSFFLSSALG